MVKFRVKSGITVGALFGFMTLALLFQNCAPQQLQGLTPAPSYSSGPQKITLAAGETAQADLCLQGQIKCYKKVYSPAVKDSTLTSSDCTLFDKKEICFPLEIINYDTNQALATCEDCDTSAGLQNGRYNREEFTCWLNVKSQNNARFFALKSDLQSALSEAMTSCLESLPAKGDQ